MEIEEVIITNFKSISGPFSFAPTQGINIIVGDNEAGKSTILEAIHLAFTGFFQGRPLSYGLNQDLFNSKIVQEYLQSFEAGNRRLSPPKIIIEVFFRGEGPEFERLRGDCNSKGGTKASGFTFLVELDPDLNDKYELFLKNSSVIKSLPIEYFHYIWKTFCRDELTNTQRIPIASIFIDTSRTFTQSSSDQFFSRILKGKLEPEQITRLSQAHRSIRENFKTNPIIDEVNQSIGQHVSLTRKHINLSVSLGTKNSWEDTVIPEIEEIPLSQAGKGTQTCVQIELALAKSQKTGFDIILIEEPENHLSHTNLNALLNRIEEETKTKQVICSTHSSFVANKLGLNNLFLLRNSHIMQLKELTEDTQKYFTALPGYDTLRYILCEKAILVEGPSDELVVQKAYKIKNGLLPIEAKEEVISVGLSFLRFLEIADILNVNTKVITDNDGKIDVLEKKYADYLGNNKKSYIEIFFDKFVDTPETFSIDPNTSKEIENLNTLETKLFKVLGLEKTNQILGKSFSNNFNCLNFMVNNKTTSAIAFFNFEGNIQFPDYINDAVS